MLIINEIDDIGGSIAAIENGYIENEITRSAYEYQKQVEEKEVSKDDLQKAVEALEEEA